uniref:Family with sequence similarity 43 member A n=1 Tax=Panthera tigris altaica TaxID=74533 RepID=A0A8C9JKU1_PANTA
GGSQLLHKVRRAPEAGPRPDRQETACSLARACPEGALSRVGSMFRSKRKKLHITSEDPTYTVLYLGNATTIQARGDGCTDLAVGKIWSKSEAGRQGTKMKLTVSAQGIRMVHAEERALRRPGHLYLLHRVTYCVADARLPKVFAWVYRHELKHKAVMLRCHAVLVSKPEKAQAMALLLYQTSANALAEFKRLKRRDDARHQQQELVGAHTIPLVPLRKLLLHGPCCYKPPVERSRSAPKLGSITEDLLGEQQEQELQEEEEEEHTEGCLEEEEEEEEEEEDRAGEEDPAAEEAEAQRALVVAMHLECGDLLDTLESGLGPSLFSLGGKSRTEGGRLVSSDHGVNESWHRWGWWGGRRKNLFPSLLQPSVTQRGNGVEVKADKNCQSCVCVCLRLFRLSVCLFLL